MPFTKGKTGNPEGRPKGKPNKITTDTRQWIAALIDRNRSRIEKDLKSLEPKERLYILEKLMGYCIPKMQSVEAKVDIEKLTDSQLNTVISELAKTIENE